MLVNCFVISRVDFCIGLLTGSPDSTNKHLGVLNAATKLIDERQMFDHVTPLIESADKLESGDSSVVTHWTVDQEVVGSNPTHGENLISVMRSLSGFTQPIR